MILRLLYFAKNKIIATKSRLVNMPFVRIVWLADLRLNSWKIRKFRISEKFCNHIFQCQKLTQKTNFWFWYCFFQLNFNQNPLQPIRLSCKDICLNSAERNWTRSPRKNCCSWRISIRTAQFYNKNFNKTLLEYKLASIYDFSWNAFRCMGFLIFVFFAEVSGLLALVCGWFQVTLSRSAPHN